MDNLNSHLENVTSVAIAGHVRPDGDCVGSCLATYNYITTYFPKIKVDVYLEPIPNIFKFLNGAKLIRTECTYPDTYDLCIVQDCGDLSRIGAAVRYFETAKRTICIDHHISNVSFADENHVYPHVSSTSELIFDLIGAEALTKQIAECIYVGMIHDTGVFQYSSTTAKTMNIAGTLMESGIDFTKIVDETFYTKTYNQNRILGLTLLESKLYLEGKCIIGRLTLEQMKEFEVLPKHLDGIVNQLRVTKDVEVAVLLYENIEGGYKVSLRSNGKVDVAAITIKYQGGGHVRAAGVNMKGTVEEIIEILCREIQAQL